MLARRNTEEEASARACPAKWQYKPTRHSSERDSSACADNRNPQERLLGDVQLGQLVRFAALLRNGALPEDHVHDTACQRGGPGARVHGNELDIFTEACFHFRQSHSPPASRQRKTLTQEWRHELFHDSFRFHCFTSCGFDVPLCPSFSAAALFSAPEGCAFDKRRDDRNRPYFLPVTIPNPSA